jgi:glucuronate isomerase
MGENTIIHDDFLLQTPFARKLYHNYAHGLPIIDYHNHLPPEQIVNDHRFENISRAWLAGDHYKWRAMRILGIQEEYITGKADDKSKFLKWASTVPYTLRNPLFHWTQLELKRYFGIDQPLDTTNAATVYEKTSEQLQQPSHGTLGLLKMMNVEVVCTTDDPSDSLEHHRQARNFDNHLKVLPAFRPDKAYTQIGSVLYRDYLEKLESSASLKIAGLSDLLEALEKRIAHFHLNGCRLADHGLEQMPFPAAKGTDSEKTFAKALKGEPVSPSEATDMVYHILQHLCRCYHKNGWVQQFHLGALRNTNKRRLAELGADTGYDSIGDFPQARALCNFLNNLEADNALAKTILYNLNPADNEVMATMAGNFSEEGVKGKIQWGSAWWYLDQKNGMERHLNALSNMGMLSCFVGMLTDSRSFLSFPRHEYFRRILCNLLGNDVARGELPQDEAWLGEIVEDICYKNAREYFPF